MTREQRQVFLACGPASQAWGAYLAGGTSAALQLGHRVSVDLDFFAPTAADPSDLQRSLARIATTVGLPLKVRQNDVGTFTGAIGNVSLSLFRYRYPLIGPCAPYLGVNLTSLSDIAAMKLEAIGSRAEKKDFIDLHELVLTRKLTLRKALDCYCRKFGAAGGNAHHVHRALTFFDDAEKAHMPRMLKQKQRSWDEIKRHLVGWAARVKPGDCL